MTDQPPDEGLACGLPEGMDLSRVLDRREQPLTGAELLAQKDQVRSGRRVLEVVDNDRLLGRIPGVEVLQDYERSLPEGRGGVAGRDEGLRAYGRGVICLDRPSARNFSTPRDFLFVVPKSRYAVIDVF